MTPKLRFCKDIKDPCYHEWLCIWERCGQPPAPFQDWLIENGYPLQGECVERVLDTNSRFYLVFPEEIRKGEYYWKSLDKIKFSRMWKVYYVDCYADTHTYIDTFSSCSLALTALLDGFALWKSEDLRRIQKLSK